MAWKKHLGQLMGKDWHEARRQNAPRRQVLKDMERFVRDLAGPDSCFVTASVRERAQAILAKLDEGE